jgi:hypothetical protein
VQRQLHSLLATMVKLCGRNKCALSSTAAVQYRGAAVYAAVALLAGAAADNQPQQHAAAGAANCRPGKAAAVSMLPSVVILGRCCLQWAEQMQAEATLCLEDQKLCSGQQQQQQGCDSDLSTAKDTFQWGLIARLSVVQQWLASGSTCNQLTAAGYAPLPVLQQLQQLLALPVLQQLLATPEPSPPDTAAKLVAAQHLQSTGLALCSFAVPGMCNNHGCTSMSGLTELSSTSGHSCICEGCRVACYCGRACQRAAWKQHRHVCAALSTAAAAAGTGAAGAGAPLAAEPAAQRSSS